MRTDPCEVTVSQGLPVRKCGDPAVTNAVHPDGDRSGFAVCAGHCDVCSDAGYRLYQPHAVTRAAIRVTGAAGPVDHTGETVLIGGYRSTAERDGEIARLRSLAAHQAPALVFGPDAGDRYDADLWGDAHLVARADAIEAALDVLRDSTGEGRGWYSTDSDGVWVDARATALGPAAEGDR